MQIVYFLISLAAAKLHTKNNKFNYSVKEPVVSSGRVRDVMKV